MKISKLIENRTEKLFSIRLDDTVADLVEELNKRHVGALVVLDDKGVLQGIVSERHVLRNAYDADKKSIRCDRPVKEIMRSKADMPTVTPDANLKDAMEIMTRQRTRHIVVTDDDEHPLACISIRDTVEKLLEHTAKENAELQKFMYGY